MKGYEKNDRSIIVSETGLPEPMWPISIQKPTT